MKALDIQPIDQPRSRRGVLALFAAGGGAVLATLLGRPGRALAADNDPLILGASNSASHNTALGASVDGFVFGVRNLSSGGAAGGIQAQSSSGGKPAVAGENDASNGIAVFGASNGPGGFGQGSGNGVHGESGSGSGVSGRSSSGSGVWGESEDGVGGAFRSTNGLALDVEGPASFVANVAGYAISIDSQSGDPGSGALTANGSGLAPVIAAISDASPIPDVDVPIAIYGGSTGGGVGVRGSSDGTGVEGNSFSLDGVGVAGFSETGIGGLFGSFNGVGLGVDGRAAFATVGAGTVPAGKNSVFVADAGVTDTSHISLTLVSNPGSRDLRWVERSPGSGFTIHLGSASGQGRPATAFTYFIVEHQEPQKG